MASSATSYAGWSLQDLTARVLELEKQLKEVQEAQLKHGRSAEPPDGQSVASPNRPVKKPRVFDWSKHTTRLIGLKFAYIGRNYNGFEHHANNTTPLPTVEETLWRALMKGKLINPTGDTAGQTNAIDWEGCDYSKCGRTDRGVSAFGQVIGLRVRSNRPPSAIDTPFDDESDEIRYVQVLNNLLPPDIKVLAWCSTLPEDFSARFSCRSRHYKYYFTQPSFMPTPGALGLRLGLATGSESNDKRREGWLDIVRMQDAARRFEGLHDFRNFCKIDPSKQISDYRRRIFRSEIRALPLEETPAADVSSPIFRETEAENQASAPPSGIYPQIYVFDLQGSAFLWHQVRHMVAVLFLIGQGLEPPSVIDDLLDVTNCPEKPHYEMADETPLVLWDCTFPREGNDPLTDDLDWRYVGDTPPVPGQRGPDSAKFGLGSAVDQMWALWRESKMDEILRGSLLNLIIRQPDILKRDPMFDLGGSSSRPPSQRVFQGGKAAVYRGKYIPLLKRQRLKSVEEVNREYAEKHGLVGKSSDGAGKGPPTKSRTDHVDHDMG